MIASPCLLPLLSALSSERPTLQLRPPLLRSAASSRWCARACLARPLPTFFTVPARFRGAFVTPTLSVYNQPHLSASHRITSSRPFCCASPFSSLLSCSDLRGHPRAVRQDEADGGARGAAPDASQARARLCTPGAPVPRGEQRTHALPRPSRPALDACSLLLVSCRSNTPRSPHSISFSPFHSLSLAGGLEAL